MINVPEQFLNKMKTLLNNDFKLFYESYNKERTYGLRINTLKVDTDDFLSFSPFHLKSIPWVKDGFYYEEQDQPGKHPYHAAGLYYIQEPSAMAAVEAAGIEYGDRVLDLCAAPGGKSVQAAARLNGTGILVANEINPSRCKILSENIERLGIRNAVVTNESPDDLRKFFPNYFDKIIVDAPCSGTGMFRKEHDICNEWNQQSCISCSQRQSNILNSAAEMLKPGGSILYSTCTFEPEEDEKVIGKFIKEYHNFHLEQIVHFPGYKSGRPDWADNDEELSKTVRLWPQYIEGEGHFIALLKSDGYSGDKCGLVLQKSYDKNLLCDYIQFEKDYMSGISFSNLLLLGNQLYNFPNDMIDIKGLKVLRAGLHLGTMKKNRFEPNHALALSLKKNEFKNTININADDQHIYSYLMGNPLNIKAEKGWNIVMVNGFSIGWGKYSDDILKNHYPKGLRWN